jgi:methionine-rich copper-binding protein CopC
LAEVSLVQSIPAAGSSGAAPKIIKLTFSEKIAPAASGFQLSMDDGMAV